MDPRLIPLNGVIALLRGDGGWPAALRDQGFRLHLVEATVFSEPQNVRANAILYRLDPNMILLCECKGGRNVTARQGRAYVAAEAEGLRAAGTFPAELDGRDDPPVATVLVGRDEMRDDLQASMTQHQLTLPLLTIGAGSASLTGSDLAGLENFAFENLACGLPPARFPIDAESPVEEVREYVLQQLVAAQSRGDQAIEVAAIAASILPDWALVGVEGQRDFMNRVAEAARLIAQAMRDDFLYESSNRVAPRVVIRRSPLQADPRGATQQWQALGRRGAHALGRTREPAIEGQMPLSLEDLAEEDTSDDA